METKICKKCGKELPTSEFYALKTSKDGLQTICKKCHCATTTENARKRREKARLDAEKAATAPVIAKIAISEMRSSYNLAKWEKDIIIDCIKNNPDKAFSYYAELLGISERTFYRKIYQHDLKELIHDVKSYSEREMADAISGIHLAKHKTLAEYEDKDLLEELWKRDYDGNIWKMVRKETTISKLFGKKK